jgi:hypothetical protein
LAPVLQGDCSNEEAATTCTSNSSDSTAAAGVGGAPAAAEAQQLLLAHGHCCSEHQAVLLQLLARLNWHLLPPAALQRLEDLALLSAGALLDIYRCAAIQCCCETWLCIGCCCPSLWCRGSLSASLVIPNAMQCNGSAVVWRDC